MDLVGGGIGGRNLQMLWEFPKPGPGRGPGVVVYVPAASYGGELDRVGQDLPAHGITMLQLALRPLDPAATAGKKLLDLAWPGASGDDEFERVRRDHLEYQTLRAVALTNEHRSLATTPRLRPVVRQEA